MKTKGLALCFQGWRTKTVNGPGPFKLSTRPAPCTAFNMVLNWPAAARTVDSEVNAVRQSIFLRSERTRQQLEFELRGIQPARLQHLETLREGIANGFDTPQCQILRRVDFERAWLCGSCQPVVQHRPARTSS